MLNHINSYVSFLIAYMLCWYLFHGWIFEYCINIWIIFIDHSTILLGFGHLKKMHHQFGGIMVSTNHSHNKPHNPTKASSMQRKGCTQRSITTEDESLSKVIHLFCEHSQQQVGFEVMLMNYDQFCELYRCHEQGATWLKN